MLQIHWSKSWYQLIKPFQPEGPILSYLFILQEEFSRGHFNTQLKKVTKYAFILNRQENIRKIRWLKIIQVF
jgi:hypothetical protein